MIEGNIGAAPKLLNDGSVAVPLAGRSIGLPDLDTIPPLARAGRYRLLVRVIAGEHLQFYPVLLFVPAILLSLALFDRGSGIVATVAAAALAAKYLVPGHAAAEVLPLALFVLTALAIAAVTEILRKTLTRLAEAKRYADVLLQERNDLATIVSILRLQARSETNPAVQSAIASAVARVDVVAKVHHRLRDSADNTRISLKPYIEALCAAKPIPGRSSPVKIC
ncbi:histidine kinase dimerization/phosphoacceptor domain -containing protein [Bradyrhizobium guangdongense]